MWKWVVGIVVGLMVIGSFGDDQEKQAEDGTQVVAPAEDKLDEIVKELNEGAAEEDDSQNDGSPGEGPETAGTKPKSKLKPRERVYRVTEVIDGDTVELGNGETVRLVGIDTPEVGDCHSVSATNRMIALVLGQEVTLGESDEDRDRYGRLLRYVDVVDGPDAGLAQIRAGVASARYDSRDGYGWHPREDRYVAADKATPSRTCAAPVPLAPPVPPPNNCMSGYSPCLPVVPDMDCGDIGHEVIVTGSDPYGLDGDGDGTACGGD